MNTGTKVAIGFVLGFMLLIGFVLGFILLIGVLISYIISAKFTANEFETSIVYSDKDMQNIHSNMNKIMKASGLTVQNFGETKIKAIQAKVAQYADKPQMMMMWIKENPEQIDSKIWEKFMDLYEKDTVNIQNAQTSKLSKAQAYQTWLGSTGKGFIAGVVFNYPTAEVKKTMELVISTESTKEAWKTGNDTEVEVPFGK